MAYTVKLPPVSATDGHHAKDSPSLPLEAFPQGLQGDASSPSGPEPETPQGQPPGRTEGDAPGGPPIPEKPVTVVTTGNGGPSGHSQEPRPAPRISVSSSRSDRLPQLGPKGIGPFTPCEICGEGTWARYGDRPFCLRCSRDPATPFRLHYREGLRRWWVLTAQGPEADRAEVLWLYHGLLRLIDEVGEPRATHLRRQWAREWWEQTGGCPFCGERGEYHEHDQSAEASP